ncbi:MAG: hypothetical protein ACOZNI_25595 [Myxococcota bacterium]
MSRWFLGVGPALLLASCAVAFAQDGAGVPAVPGGTAPSLDYLLSLGPYGALVWGAYLLGKGVKVTIQVELSERDRVLLQESCREVAHERLARG